ncbi:TPA: hypothetical protein HA244_04130 [Candidatus Micrarchaeota archaeon]|nr:hypothetical protein [Candidatus Micrarchaeota archaeon]
MVVAEVALLIFGLIIFMGFFAAMFFERTKIPDIVILLLLGVLLGSVFQVVNPGDFIPLASTVGTLALIVVLFDGGLHLDLLTIMRQIPNAALFSTVVFVLGALLVGGLLHFALGWPLLHALILGVIAGGTGSNEVLPLVQRLSLNGKSKVLLSLDSLINDVLTFVFIFLILQVATTGSFSVSSTLGSVASAFSIALLAGVVCGIAWLQMMKRFSPLPFAYMITLGFMFILYSAINFVGGSGAIAVLVFSLALGNSALISQFLKSKEQFVLDPSIITVQKEISFFVRTFYFVYLGLLFTPQFFSASVAIIASIALAGFFAARYVGTLVISAVDSSFRKYSVAIATMLPRGLISTVVLFLPAEKGIFIPYLVEAVFLLVLFSNVITLAGAFVFERNSLETARTSKPSVVAIGSSRRN